VPNSGLAVAIDIGEEKDIHPKNKQDVGKRLALNALAKVYGKNVEFGGPTFATAEPAGNTLRVTFTHADGLKTVDGKAPTGFAIAGDDGKFVWATAKIDGGAVVLSSPAIAEPKFVRYAWANNPQVNLINAASLPAVPFRNDEFPK
jgi:sialate O-acetylesterase